MSVEHHIRRETRGEAAWVIIDRPDVHNALARQTLVELAEAIRAADADRSVASAVVTGAGDAAFCAGGDVAEMRDLDGASGERFLEAFADVVRAIRGTGKPVIARINGYCLGGGNELNLVCDLSVACDRAVFGQVGARVGGVPVVGVTELLPSTVGQKRAREILFLCQRYTAEDACRMGLVNRVVPSEELDAVVAEWTGRIAELSPQALRLAKRALNRGTDALLPSREQVEAVKAMFETEEYREGMTAFLEKRRPDFRRFR